MPLTMLAAKSFLSKAWPFLLAAAVAILIVAVYLSGKSAGKGEAETARLESNVEALEDKGTADANAATARTEDAVRATVERTELEEAVNNAPDDPAARRRAYYECLAKLQQARKGGGAAPSCG